MCDLLGVVSATAVLLSHGLTPPSAPPQDTTDTVKPINKVENGYSHLWMFIGAAIVVIVAITMWVIVS